ncbi:hypothetical protein SAMN02745181_0231 [Rubritalea squalenifaciens DSM 18772]|uniref:Uncharacterized protein n=2 Tax=Rubritalea TaxID=361050 RepID=A0A1M6BIL1_9BACT|nr:hypothetical protein [Rubritalea squalenifaciens]SHI48551.1 hypothetical protein SAMN02745181_0231 [Rubritalea squalenifaciens DSM 18772]
MAYRLDKAVVKGWIDNTSPGMTRGALEIMGLDRPVKLILRGNCWRDLAGTRLDFTNPSPELQEDVVEAMHTLQRGVIGDMTASIKVRIPTVPQSEFENYTSKNQDIPSVWRNALYLEWFSLVNGRCIIETADYQVKVSSHQWELDADGEKKQREENAMAMEHFMELMLTASEAESEVADAEGEVDEFEWEKRLRVRDSLEEAAWFLGEGPAETTIEIHEVEEMPTKNRHQIVQHAYLVQHKTIELLGNAILDDGPRSELALAIGYICDAIDECWPSKKVNLENGYRVAILKRTLEACNSAIAATNTLAMEDDKYEELRSLIFHLRDMMVDLSHGLRDSEPGPEGQD